MNRLISIISQFSIEGDVCSVRRLGNGLINDTYFVETSGDTPDYVLQRINHNIFKDVEGMQRNIQIVTHHIRRKLQEKNIEDIDRKVLQFVSVKDSDKTFLQLEGEYWRVSRFISGSHTMNEVSTASAFDAGKSFGNFQFMLTDLDEHLIESIPDFHDMEFRLSQLDEAVGRDAVGRVSEVKDILVEIDKRRTRMCEPEMMYREGMLSKRICHCDTKVNNMLFNDSGEVLCVIDLDTVMPSFVSSDFGDFLRTGACTTVEDESDISKINFDMDIFKAFSKGYLSEAGKFLSDKELALLPESVALFPYMQAVRFLTDYINGDIYYKTDYSTHNLVRTRAQMQLLYRIEEKMAEIRNYIQTIINANRENICDKNT